MHYQREPVLSFAGKDDKLPKPVREYREKYTHDVLLGANSDWIDFPGRLRRGFHATNALLRFFEPSWANTRSTAATTSLAFRCNSRS